MKRTHVSGAARGLSAPMPDWNRREFCHGVGITNWEFVGPVSLYGWTGGIYLPRVDAN